MFSIQDVPGDVNLFVTAAVGFAGSLLLGGAKTIGGKLAVKFGVVDTKIVNAIKPVQPLILMGLTWGLPLLAAKLNIVTPDATAIVSAPIAAVFGVVAR